ncbi:ABC transporter ATP-binding protein [Litorimonas sp. RW-G-Af-16]|uniref:ABC transporter ATP-binding protein n=1 Tax=Litorimonas sp. RW-G-Af-16 TaxID=3241168 RepID=UPI00390C526C
MSQQAPLSIRNVSKSFGGKPAVRDVSFDIQRGEIVGFLGPNGAGKTTTLRMALGLIRPDIGEIDLFGQIPGEASFGRIGFLPEERGLYKKQTARESIAHMARLNGIHKREAFALADNLLDRYGLGDAKRKKNKDMSKGMAQKVQLLSAIAHSPEFYILDEPFSGLDPVNQQVLEGIVREISQGGNTIIFSTHVMEHAERLCDRIILMAGGRKVFDGPTEDALAKAPRRLIIASESAALTDLVTPFSEDLTIRKDGALMLTLKDGVDSHSLLERCVAQTIKLTRYEPKTPTLHEAFVALVGKDVAEAMETPDAALENSQETPLPRSGVDA